MHSAFPLLFPRGSDRRKLGLGRETAITAQIMPLGATNGMKPVFRNEGAARMVKRPQVATSNPMPVRHPTRPNPASSKRT